MESRSFPFNTTKRDASPNEEVKMRKNLSLTSAILITIVLLLSSCFKCLDCDYDYLLYQIENKLSYPIQVGFECYSDPGRNFETTIESNEIKDIIKGTTGLGFGLVSYDSAFMKVNTSEYIYQRTHETGLLSSSTYKDIGTSKKNGRILYIRKLIVDEEFLLKSNE